jgi:hypothetical protein
MMKFTCVVNANVTSQMKVGKYHINIKGNFQITGKSAFESKLKSLQSLQGKEVEVEETQNCCDKTDTVGQT